MATDGERPLWQVDTVKPCMRAGRYEILAYYADGIGKATVRSISLDSDVTQKPRLDDVLLIAEETLEASQVVGALAVIQWCEHPEFEETRRELAGGVLVVPGATTEKRIANAVHVFDDRGIGSVMWQHDNDTEHTSLSPVVYMPTTSDPADYAVAALRVHTAPGVGPLYVARRQHESFAIMTPEYAGVA